MFSKILADNEVRESVGSYNNEQKLGLSKILCLQVRQRLLPQGVLPRAGESSGGESSACTKRTLRFLGRL